MKLDLKLFLMLLWPLRRPEANRQDARQYHPSVLDFTDGVEVTEMVLVPFPVSCIFCSRHM